MLGKPRKISLYWRSHEKSPLRTGVCPPTSWWPTATPSASRPSSRSPPPSHGKWGKPRAASPAKTKWHSIRGKLSSTRGGKFTYVPGRGVRQDACIRQIGYDQHQLDILQMGKDITCTGCGKSVHKGQSRLCLSRLSLRWSQARYYQS